MSGTTSMDALNNKWSQFASPDDERPETVFLEPPTTRERKYVLISADDHVVEPPDTFDGRLASKWLDRAPRVVEQENGRQVWLYDDTVIPNVGMNAVVGKPLELRSFEPARFDEMVPGSWDIRARVEDMDRDGVFASVCFPSQLAGFGGVRLQTTTKDQELALAVLRAYNDWHLEAWAAPYPGRIIPQQLPWLANPEVGAAEIRRNAERGFRAVTFPEYPDQVGFPSLYTDYWNPFFEACAETGTVVNLHTGSSGVLPITSQDCPLDVAAVLFGMVAMLPTVDWLFSQVTIKFPELKVVLSEGGIGWVSGLLDRLESQQPFIEMTGFWKSQDLTPSDSLRRNFWFCALTDLNAFRLRDHIGVDNILSETDYPHRDSLWPDSQEIIHRQLRTIPRSEADQVTWGNASELYRWPVPAEVIDDPTSFSVDAQYSVTYPMG